MTLLIILLTFSAGHAMEENMNAPPCIVGPTEITQGGQFLFYTTANAQCNNCHDWDISGNATISGSDQGGAVFVNANSVGQFTLNLTYFTENGCFTCTRTFNIIPAEPEPCLEPEFTSKVFCDANPPAEPGGHGTVTITNWGDATSPVESLTYIFNAADNNGNFANFSFSQNSTVTSKTIYSTGAVNYWFDPGTCPSSGNTITFRVIVTFASKECETIDENFDVIYDCGGCSPLLEPAINLSPNPATNGSTISFQGIEANKVTAIEVHDLYGNKKLSMKPENQNFMIAGLNSGIYFVTFSTTTGTSIQKKLVIE